MSDEHRPIADLESRKKEATALRNVTDALADDVKDAHDKKEIAEAVKEATKHYDNAPFGSSSRSWSNGTSAKRSITRTTASSS